MIKKCGVIYDAMYRSIWGGDSQEGRAKMYRIAIAVRDVDLFLVANVVRKATVGATASNVYVEWPRSHIVGWCPHTSYHASGLHHHKSYGKAFSANTKQQQIPDASFSGAVNVVSFGLTAGEHNDINEICDPRKFDAIFEIPVALVRPERYSTYVHVDLVAPGENPLLIPGASPKWQKTFKDAEPWIVLTFLES